MHYRYTRTSDLGEEIVDVMVPDHAPPRAYRKLRGRDTFKIEGGTQALARGMRYRMEAGPQINVEVAVPDELGALVLKGAAFGGDNRDRDRHLQDAAVLAACITDPVAELRRLKGNDTKRIRRLRSALEDPSHPAWLVMSVERRRMGQDTLRILGGNR